MGATTEDSTLQDAVSAHANPALLMERIVKEIRELIQGADGAAILMLGPEGYLTPVSAVGSLRDFLGQPLPLEESLSGRAVLTRSVIYSPDAFNDERVNKAARALTNTRSMACVPLQIVDEAIGTILVTSIRKNALDNGDIESLERLAEFISVFINSSSQIDQATANIFLESSCSAPVEGLLPAPSNTQGRSSREGVTAFVANVLTPGLLADFTARKRIKTALGASQLSLLFQPLVDLRSGVVIGVEALSRFPTAPQRPPDVWFAEAHSVGLGLELELLAVTSALQVLNKLPPEMLLSINVGPDTLVSPELRSLLVEIDQRRIVLELTEHERIDDYREVHSRLACLRQGGIRLAIDDTGTGFSSLAHILKLSPDLIKLDIGLTGGIHLDPVRRALASSLVSFARETGAQIIAEGIAEENELRTLRGLGITYGQGFHLACPMPIEDIPLQVPISNK